MSTEKLFHRKLERGQKQAKLTDELKEMAHSAEKSQPSYEIVRGGSDLEKALLERLRKAVQEDEKYLQIGEAKPTGEQTEVVPETAVNDDFLESLPPQREFVIYANAYDLSTTPENLRASLGHNTLIVFEADHPLLKELNFRSDDRQVA